MTDLLIKNATIVTLGEKNSIIPAHSLLIKNGLISKILPSNKVEKNIKVKNTIDAKGKILLPGFINVHTHFYSAFARGMPGIAPSKNFQEILNNLWWRLDKRLTPEDIYNSTLVTLMECIRHGTTTVIDHHASPMSIEGSLDTIASAVSLSGLRACLCYEVSDRDGEEIALQGIQENARFAKKLKRNPDQKLAGLMGLHASFTLSDETLELAADKANDAGVGFHIHCAEDACDQDITRKKYGTSVVERLYNKGILGPNTICAHGVHLGDEEINILRETRTILAHNPQSNMNNAVGIMNLVKMIKMNVLVGLGTDAMTSNMLEELRSAIWAQKLVQHNPGSGFSEAVSTLTKNNAIAASRFWGREFGVIKEGTPADVILIDYDPPTPMNSENFAGHLVFGLSQTPVDTTIASGNILMRKKEIVCMDEEKICARSRELAEIIWKRMN